MWKNELWFLWRVELKRLRVRLFFLYVSLKLHKSNWLEGWWVSASQRLFWGRMTRGVHHIFAFHFAKSWRYHLDTDSMREPIKSRTRDICSHFYKISLLFKSSEQKTRSSTFNWLTLRRSLKSAAFLFHICFYRALYEQFLCWLRLMCLWRLLNTRK